MILTAAIVVLAARFGHVAVVVERVRSAAARAGPAVLVQADIPAADRDLLRKIEVTSGILAADDRLAGRDGREVQTSLNQLTADVGMLGPEVPEALRGELRLQLTTLRHAVSEHDAKIATRAALAMHSRLATLGQ